MESAGEIDPNRLRDLATLEGSLAQRVYLAVKECILSLDFAPGAILRKGEICDALGVSRSPVSEALTRLSEDGLVDIVPQSGSRVSYFAMSEIREGAFLREALELAAAAKVARDRSEDQLMRLNRNLRLQALLVEDDDHAGFFEADQEFHAMLMRFTGYGRVSEIAEAVSAQVLRARILLLPEPGRVPDTIVEHEAILDAIRARDPDAVRAAMRHHLGQLMPRIEVLSRARPELFNRPQDSKRTA